MNICVCVCAHREREREREDIGAENEQVLGERWRSKKEVSFVKRIRGLRKLQTLVIIY